MTEEMKVENGQGGEKSAEGKVANDIKDILEGVDIADGGIKDSSGESPVPSVDAGSDEVLRLKKEAESLKDAWTRERAEFMNYKKRIVLEQARFRIDVIAEFAKNLFPVMDNLDRVLQVENPDPALNNFISGVEMIKKEFITVFEKESIRQVNPINQEFDPFKMEAIAMENRSDIDKDTVTEVFQYGYIYEKDENDRKLLRPARVKVAKKS